MSEKMGTQDFEKIYERYKTTLYRIAFTYLKNNVDVRMHQRRTARCLL